jgi:serine/threonine protein kinase
LLARIDHANVARVFDHGIDDNHVFIAMEYFPCGDLKLALEKGISVHTALGFVREIAEGLAAMHALGIIHRDIKPANIMLRNDGSVALVDFGIAKELDAANTFTRNGEMIGTPHYMSPEQIRAKTLDARSDLYSLGALFYQMLTHATPFNGERIESVLMQHLHAPRPMLPPNLAILQPLIDRLMAVDPDQRYANVAAFLKDFSVVELMRFSDDVGAHAKSFSGMADLDTLPKN